LRVSSLGNSSNWNEALATSNAAPLKKLIKATDKDVGGRVWTS
jgi:hypothetical protein